LEKVIWKGTGDDTSVATANALTESIRFLDGMIISRIGFKNRFWEEQASALPLRPAKNAGFLALRAHFSTLKGIS
jgi:hypothetical protein